MDTRCKLNVHKTFRIRPIRLLNVLYTFNLRPMSRGWEFDSPGDFSRPQKLIQKVEILKPLEKMKLLNRILGYYTVVKLYGVVQHGNYSLCLNSHMLKLLQLKTEIIVIHPQILKKLSNFIFV